MAISFNVRNGSKMRLQAIKPLPALHYISQERVIGRKDARLLRTESAYERECIIVSRRVEFHHRLIKQQLAEFFNKQSCQNIDGFIQDVVASKVRFSYHSLLTRVLNESSLAVLLKKLKHNIQMDINAVYKLSSMKVATFNPAMGNPNVEDALAVAEENLNTLMVAKSALAASNRIWRNCTDEYNVSPLLSEFLPKIELGSIYMNIVGCHPNDEGIRTQSQLAKQLRGVIKIFHQNLSREFCLTTAQALYAIHDQIWQQRYEKEAKIAKRNTEQKITLLLEKRAG
jgi:hypothetical protein